MSRIEELKKFLIDEPHDSFLNYALALEYAKSGDIPKAIEIITSLLDSDPDYLGAYYQLGKYHETLQQHEIAIATYQKGISIAQKLNNKKALGELNEALWMLED